MDRPTMTPALHLPPGALGTDAAVAFTDEARAALATAGDVTVSLEDTTDVTGAGAQVLLALRKSLTRRGDHLRLIRVPSHLVPLLDWCGLESTPGD